MKEQKLKFMPSAQAHVEIHDTYTMLVSYTTDVACLTKDGWLTIFGLYSATTRRHISAFLKEYTDSRISFKVAKQVLESGDCINICTGELRPANEY